MKHFLLTFAFLALMLTPGKAQNFNYDNNSNFYLTAGLGYLWHTSDVKTIDVKKKFPIGVTVLGGYTFLSKPQYLFSFDVGARLLGGAWYGMDTEPTHTLVNNAPFENLLLTDGQVVQNFRTTNFSLDLEVSLHLNRTRQTIGLDPYVFASIGTVATQTKGAMISNPSYSPYKSDFTDPLVKNEDGELHDLMKSDSKILPSLGIGLGYFFKGYFSIGVEHRTTFFMGDYLDGTTLNHMAEPSKSPFKNDMYHYSSVYFRMYFKPIKPKDPVRPVRENESTIDDNINTAGLPPVVNFTDPAKSPTRVSNSKYLLKAKVKYVNSSDKLTFTHNGVNITGFPYNPSTGDFQYMVDLQPGENVFTLYGYNEYGNDSDQTIIILEDKLLPPKVRIVDPAKAPHTVAQTTYTIKANIENIEDRSQLTVTYNGQPFTSYTFTPQGTMNFTANVNLQAGENKMVIRGTNKAGSDQDQTIIIYSRMPK